MTGAQGAAGGGAGSLGALSGAAADALTQALGQAPWLAALAALAVGATAYVLLYPRLLVRFARAENQVRLERAVNEVDCRAAQLARLAELGLSPDQLSPAGPPPEPAP